MFGFVTILSAIRDRMNSTSSAGEEIVFFRSFRVTLPAAFAAIVFSQVAAAVPACAQTGEPFPNRPITITVPWPAGGRTDLTARLTARFLTTKLGTPVVVVNKPGASGVLGAKEVAHAKPDGYSLGMFSSGVVATQYTVPTPSDLKEYAPVGLINMDEAVLAVPHASQFKDLAALVKYARENPGKLRLGTAPGTSAHIMAALFSRSAKVDFLAVPFGGGGARSIALAGEHIDVDIDVPAIYTSMQDAKKVRLLGLGAGKRSALFPDIPTFREAGVDSVIGTWNGLFAPKGTPNDVLAKLENALGEVSRDPQFVELMHKALLSVRFMDRQEFVQFLKRDDEGTKQITSELGLQAK
jgi:tripartite-type tricarboxylate transporter receptor subunit TctC